MNTARNRSSAERRPSFLTRIRRVEGHLQRKTLDGLLALIPLLVTIFVLGFIVSYADGFVTSIPYLAGQPWLFPGIGLIAMIVVFYIFGVLVDTRAGRRVMDWKSLVLNHIPIIKTVFGATEQATTTIAGAGYNFSRVVFLEWPREGMVAIGFVTGRAYSRSEKHSLAIVYIPTVPNPTSGNLAIVNEDDLYETDLSVENAVKLVFSGGIVLPPTLAMARMARISVKDEFIGTFETHSDS